MYQVKPRSRLARPLGEKRSLGVARRTQAARTEATRRKLISAAARIFARDGFEAARLEDIAALAGYTRGAFYANFSDKEDLFFALLEEWIRERVSELDALLRSKGPDRNKRLGALRDYYANCAKDRRLALLSLEFSLHAIRHPSAHARLRGRKRRLRTYADDLIRGIAGPRPTPDAKGRRPLPVSARAVTAALGAFSSALLLEHVVDPTTVTESDVPHLLGIFFDALLLPPTTN
jgi:AcrR family transcriptional regulator